MVFLSYAAGCNSPKYAQHVSLGPQVGGHDLGLQALLVDEVGGVANLSGVQVVAGRNKSSWRVETKPSGGLKQNQVVG